MLQIGYYQWRNEGRTGDGAPGAGEKGAQKELHHNRNPWAQCP